MLFIGHFWASPSRLLIGSGKDLSLILWVRGGWKVTHDQYKTNLQLGPTPFSFLLLSINHAAGGTLFPVGWLASMSFILL